jgi:SAM-dependent methyltransferase
MKSPPSFSQHYEVLFTQTSEWSTPWPNTDEALRFGKLVGMLSKIADERRITPGGTPLRILDVGCGRGWLTNLVSVFGETEGVDPVESSIVLARKYFSDLTFTCGTASDIVSASDFKPYDVVVTSEVIEHITDKDGFLRELKACLTPGGSVAMTTPRKELFSKWRAAGFSGQPIEEWLSERELLGLFAKHGFVAVSHDRIYTDLPGLSTLHRLCSARQIRQLLERLHLPHALESLKYFLAIYQVWSFRLPLTLR